jgi:carotenoid 1,2-hydratase
MQTDGSGLEFDARIAPGGYAWWYVDALSADGRHGLTIIALLGSVFSPYYARARRSAVPDPLEHSALNVALYGHSGHRWAMTERRRGDIVRTPGSLQIGPSVIRWDGASLTIRIDEITAPWPTRIRGTVRVTPRALFDRSYLLDAAGRHRWHPIAPRAAVEVDLDQPGLQWQGDGYLDSNEGDVALEADFDGWTWSRSSVGDDTAVFYDVERCGGDHMSLALAFDADGNARTIQPPPVATLPGTLWRIPRSTRCDAGSVPRIVDTLEDGPFYARSVVEARALGSPVVAVHESLSLRRFRKPWVRMLLPFRMPRPPSRRASQ